MGTAFVFKDSSFESWNFSILKISKMIPKMMIVILAALLIAVEAKSGQDLIGERLKGFHDHFTSQAKVITDAGINTENIMKSLSTQLKSLLQDAVKEMDGLEAKYKQAVAAKVPLVEEISSLKTKNEELSKNNDKLTKDKAQLEKDRAILTDDNERMAEKIKTLEKDLKNVTETCHDALTKCKNNIEELGSKILDLQRENSDLTNQNNNLKKELEDTKRLCHKTLEEIYAEVKKLAGQVDDLNAEKNDLQNKLNKCETDKGDLNVEKNNLQKKLKKCVADMEDELKKHKDEKDKCRVDLEVCRGGWEKVNGRYVKHFNDQKLTWSEAKASCEKRNAQLLMVTDDETAAWTKKTIHTATWIGATDEANEGEWKWVDGSSVDKTKKAKYWGAGEPDSGLGLVDEDCLATGFELFWIHYGEWADEVCKAKFTFACELPKV